MKTRYIIISGIDGSGKTTVINALEDALQNKGYTASYIWMRYSHYLLKVMNALARLLGLSVKVHNAMGEIWEHRLYKKPWFCKIYVWCSYLDNKIARLKVTRLKTDYVICDRWINDVLIDLGAECRFMDILDSKWFDRFQDILPRENFQFLIIRDKQSVLDCRLENHTNPDFSQRYNLYEKLMNKDVVNVVNNNGSIDDSVAQIVDVLKI